MKYFAFLAIAFALVSCTDEIRYKDASLPVEKRVEDLLSRMTLEEKVGQMNQLVGLELIFKTEKTDLTKEEMDRGQVVAYYPGFPADSVCALIRRGHVGSFLHVQTLKEANMLQEMAMESPLGIPILFGIDAIHGNANCPGNTVYPTNIGLASSFDTDLAYRIARQTAKEMRSMNMHWTFNPNIEVARDARWGRCGETFGEDPYLVGQMGYQTVLGYQDNLDSQEDVLACIKHFTGGSFSENGINGAPAEISERTLRETFFPPYELGVKAGAMSLMPSHNEVSGVPCHASRWLLTDVLRDEWGFEGFVISDWMDIEFINELHHTAVDHKDAFRQSIEAGMDMHMHGPEWLPLVCELVREGTIPESRIDESVRRILGIKFRLGLFEHPFADPQTAEQVQLCDEHRATALEAARKGVVLLKNDGILPLDAKKFRRVMVTGISADDINMMGDWTAWQDPEDYTTVIEGLREVSPQTEFDFVDVGCLPMSMKMADVDKAVKAARKADLAVIVAGDYQYRENWGLRTSGENCDRTDLNLPGLQSELIRKVAATGTPVVLVLNSGRPLSVVWEAENLPAVLNAWEPGMYGGQAIAEILYGKVNPSAKLAMTMPRNAGQIHIWYNHKPTAYFHPYVWSSSDPLYPFGYGLSYTEYAYSELKLDRDSVPCDGSLKATVTVSNEGSMAGEEIVQMYIRDDVSSVTRPVKELKGFKRVYLEPGQKAEVEFEITPQMLEFYNLDMEKVVEPGTFTVMVGPSSEDSKLLVTRFTVE